MSIFNPDSKLMEALSSFGEMMLLNLCFLVGGLPIVTIGASVTAMYTMMGRRLRQEGSGIVAPFFKAWWQNLAPATGLWLAQVVITVLLGSTFFLALPLFIRVLAAMVLVIVTMLFPILYAQLARFRNRLFAYLKNAVILLVYKLGWVVASLALTIAPVLFFLLFPVTFFQYGFLWLLFGFSALYYASALLMRKILQPLEDQIAPK